MKCNAFVANVHYDEAVALWDTLYCAHALIVLSFH